MNFEIAVGFATQSSEDFDLKWTICRLNLAVGLSTRTSKAFEIDEGHQKDVSDETLTFELIRETQLPRSSSLVELFYETKP
jgi:hypothetical protein